MTKWPNSYTLKMHFSYVTLLYWKLFCYKSKKFLQVGLKQKLTQKRRFYQWILQKLSQCRLIALIKFNFVCVGDVATNHQKNENLQISVKI